MNPKSRIYFDYAATTPVDTAVLQVMRPYLTTAFGNPGSLHSFGQEAIAAVDHSRETIARAIGAEFREVIFTASATEANNLALRGFVKKSGIEKPRIIISAIEHESILEPARELERDGIEVVYLPVDRSGRIDMKKLKTSLNEDTVAISIIYANNEIGAIQSIPEIAKIIHEFVPQALFHTDAAQAFQFLDCNVNELGVDLMTISSHKIYGPKGAAALYVRGGKDSAPGKVLRPLLFGGGQEYDFRPGTENVPAISGFAKAVELATEAREKESKRITGLRNELWRGIKKIYPKAEWNGTGASSPKNFGDPATLSTLPNILNVYFPGHQAQDLLTRFDLAGLAASSGSACRSRAFETSYVIEALAASKNPRERARSSIRFSLGRPTTKGEIASALKIIKKALA